MERSDVIIIGSGINSLVAAALLSKSGQKVLVLERNRQAGGAIKTVTTATLPGFTHELLSSWHPLFVGGPAYGELKADLEARGLVYLNTDKPTGVVCEGGSAILSTDLAATAAEFARLGDGDAWTNMLNEFLGKIDLAFGLLGADLWRSNSLKLLRTARKRFGNRGLVATGAELLEPASPWLDRTFTSPVSKALLAPWALHNGLGPDDAASAFITKVIGAAVALGGMPVPVGGGIKLVDALTSILADNGGTLITDADVVKINVSGGRATGVKLADGREFAADKSILASATPQALYQGLLKGENLPDETTKSAESFRYGRSAIQIHLALSEPPAWKADANLKDVAIVHVLDGMNSLSESVNASNRGYLPKRPTIVVGQPTAVDKSRAPEGKFILWLQLQENPQKILGDLAGEIAPGDGSWSDERLSAYADRVIDQLSEQITNLKSATLAKVVLGPKQIEEMNKNLVGGDPYAGDCRIDQYAVWRPLASATGHKTPIKGLWHIGASTHPGPGLGGGSGYLVAKRLTQKRLFKR
ncbi:MAG: NAD(P)-binding protein [Actinobacteria bacterium]|uniref:Pyridine nucleotide-disulfide oxidoreductase domain-containing protein 2 n=1 Tax=freshwater metagenome TaxID=449393 RepID=A0A6J6HS70_9ZZZZ|nr:NAD(P)-binding protein [Actinomycetota bacterium]